MVRTLNSQEIARKLSFRMKSQSHCKVCRCACLVTCCACESCRPTLRH